MSVRDKLHLPDLQPAPLLTVKVEARVQGGNMLRNFRSLGGDALVADLLRDAGFTHGVWRLRLLNFTKANANLPAVDVRGVAPHGVTLRVLPGGRHTEAVVAVLFCDRDSGTTPEILQARLKRVLATEQPETSTPTLAPEILSMPAPTIAIPTGAHTTTPSTNGTSAGTPAPVKKDDRACPRRVTNIQFLKVCDCLRNDREWFLAERPTAERAAAFVSDKVSFVVPPSTIVDAKEATAISWVTKSSRHTTGRTSKGIKAAQMVTRLRAAFLELCHSIGHTPTIDLAWPPNEELDARLQAEKDAAQ